MNIVFVESLGMCECTINKSLATLKNQGHTVTFYHDRNENEEVLIERARNAEVVVVSNIPLRKHFFENCPKLRMLSVAFTGVDHIDLEACKKRGITVCRQPGSALLCPEKRTNSRSSRRCLRSGTSASSEPGII